MGTELLSWYIYEITTGGTPIHGIKLRGRIRKFGLDNNLNVLAENANDSENCVRFAVLDKLHADELINYIKTVVNDCKIELIEKNVQNPVLSKMLVNYVDRYEL